MNFSKQSKTSVQSFILTFFTSLIIFGVAAWMIFKGVSAQFFTTKYPDSSVDPDGNPITGDPVNPDYQEGGDDNKIDGDSFTLLVAGYDVSGEAIDAMLILDVNKETRKVIFYPVNPNAKVYVGYGNGGSVYVRLGDLCRFKDMAYIADKVTALTAISVDYYISITAEGFINAVDWLNQKGTYTYTVPKDMHHVYSDKKELSQYNINFKKGQKLTSGIDLYNVLRYEGDSDSERISRQMTIVKAALKDVINGHFRGKEEKKVTSLMLVLFQTMTNSETNVPLNTFFKDSLELLCAIPDFTFETSNKFKTSTVNFK